MAVTNFQNSDFPKGKKGAEERHGEPREDNKILEREIEHAIRNSREGDQFAEDFGKKVDEANKKLNEEVSRTETPIDEQTAPKGVSKKADEKKAADKKLDEVVDAAVNTDEDAPDEDKKPAARKSAAKKSETTKPTD